jgi:hypothetical protein
MTMTTAGTQATDGRIQARPDVPGRLLVAHPGEGYFRLGPVGAEPEPGFRAAPVAVGCSKVTCLCR